LATLFNFKGAFLAILGNNHNQKKCLHSKNVDRGSFPLVTTTLIDEKRPTI
jgi:hypothetical protein